MACQGPGGHRGQQESLGKMVPEETLVMLDQEENQDSLDQRVILEDLALVILGQEDHRVTEEIRATVDLVAAEETVVKRVTLEIKELREREVNQGLKGNLAKEDQEETLDVTEILDLREIPASLNVMS